MHFTETQSSWAWGVTWVILIIALALAITGVVLAEIDSDEQGAFVTKLEQYVSITAQGCVRAKCFTDADATHSTRATNVPFSASGGAVVCSTLSAQSVAASAQISVSDATDSVLLNAGEVTLTSGTTTMLLTPSAITCSTDLTVTNSAKFGKLLTLGDYTTSARLALSPPNGTLVYDTDEKIVCVFQDSIWATFDLGVQSVNGTSNQIVVGGDPENPVVSIDPILYASLLQWENLAPLGTPTSGQFLQYFPTRLSWQSIGTQPFNASRNIYVDKSGNDTTGNGTNLSPFLTVAKAVQIALAGNTSVTVQTSIMIGTGNYTEVNPIVITKSGINLVGDTSRGCILSPVDASQNFFSLSGTSISAFAVRFQSSSSTAACFDVSNVFNLCFFNCLFNGFTTALLCNGTGNDACLCLVTNSTFVQNAWALNLQGLTCILDDCQITGDLLSPPSSSFNGISVANSDTVLFLSDSYFIRTGTGVDTSNSAHAWISACNFSYNEISCRVASQAVVDISSSNVLRTDTGHTGFIATGSGTMLKLGNCSFDGKNAAGVISGTGVVVSAGANCEIQSGFVTNCVLGVSTAGTASTFCSVGNSNFTNNTVSVHVQGTSSFTGLLLVVDDSTTLVFDSTDNVQLLFSAQDGKLLNVGSLQNEQLDVLNIGTKLTNSPGLLYNPSVYGTETLEFTNPDPAVSSTFAVVSTNHAHVDILTTSLSSHTGMHLYADLSNFDGTQIRGWHIYKNDTSVLRFAFDNNIATPVATDHCLLELDSPNSLLNVFESKIAWTGGSAIFENSPGVLQFNTNVIVGGLTPLTALACDALNQVVSSATTAVQLGYLSTTTSDIQVQLDAKLSLGGGTVTGNILFTNAGSASSPVLNLNGAGLYSSTTKHLDFATNNANRLDISDSGVFTLPGFGVGVAHFGAITPNVLSSSLIVDADITLGTIGTDKLAAKSVFNDANTIVVRDASSNFETNMITLFGATVNPMDAASKAYVDTQVSNGLVVHPAVVVVSLTNVALLGSQTIDGILVVENDRVLLTGQTTTSDNGAWVVHDPGAWTRPADFASGLAKAAYFLVQEGTSEGGSSWVCTTPGATIGNPNAIAFALFSLPQTLSGTNLGTGQGDVFSDVLGTNMRFRTLLEGTSVNISNTTNEVLISVVSSSSNVLSTIVTRDGSGNFAASTITADLVGHASQDMKLTGSTPMTGNLVCVAGNLASPGLQIGTSQYGLSQESGFLQISAGGLLGIKIGGSQDVTLPGLTTLGVVHNSAAGVLSTSLIFNDDITDTTIANTKLATISDTNAPGKIVVRDGSGNFAAGIITATLVGNVTGTVTGHATADLLLTGGVLSGFIQVPGGSSPTLQIADSKTGIGSTSSGLQLFTNNTVYLDISSAGVVTLANLSSGGSLVVHASSTGLLTSALVSNADLAGSIQDSKLSTIATAGKVANSATTATDANTANAIISRNSSNAFSATTANLTNAYFVGSTVPSNVASNGAIYVNSTTQDLIYVYNNIEYPIAGPNVRVSGRADGTVAQVLYNDSSIAFNWDQTNKQLRFQIPSGTTWQGSSSVQVSSYLSFNTATPSTQVIAITPLVALTNYYCCAGAATGIRVAGMDMKNANGNDVRIKIMPGLLTTSTLYYFIIELFGSNNSAVYSWTITKLNS
jgi:hypothetical protein